MKEGHNEIVFSKLWVSDYDDDVLQPFLDNAEDSFSSEPVQLDEVYVSFVNLTRSLPVRELTAEGWRTRVVNHCIETGFNHCTEPIERVTHDTLDVLICMLSKFMVAGVTFDFMCLDVTVVIFRHHEFVKRGPAFNDPASPRKQR